MNFDRQLKQLLDSSDKSDHLLALQVSSLAKWTDSEIMDYFLNSGHNWEIDFLPYEFDVDDKCKTFCGSEIVIQPYLIDFEREEHFDIRFGNRGSIIINYPEPLESQLVQLKDEALFFITEIREYFEIYSQC